MKDPKSYKTIRISEETWQVLANLGVWGMSMEDIIIKLIELSKRMDGYE